MGSVLLPNGVHAFRRPLLSLNVEIGEVGHRLCWKCRMPSECQEPQLSVPTADVPSASDEAFAIKLPNSAAKS